MKNAILLVLLLSFSHVSFAGWSWTNGHYTGQGVTVLDIYPQWDQHWLVFLGGDGKRYYYNWGAGDMDERAKTFFSMLLTAYTAKKRVSIYKNDVPGSTTWHEFTFLRLHD